MSYTDGYWVGVNTLFDRFFAFQDAIERAQILSQASIPRDL